MKKRILISPNSFKECADAVSIAELIWNNLFHLTDAELIMKPISDGGDGFLNVCKYYFGGIVKVYSISTAYDNSNFDCSVLYSENRKELYIESAEVLGLKIIPSHFRNPLKLSSKGLGQLLLKINEDVKRGQIEVEKVFVGIGGTSTIDMGMGMMSELGIKFFDSENKELIVLPENFLKVQTINYNQISLSFDLIPIIDVTNPLLGNNNGIEVYARQKGGDEKTIYLLIKSFNHLINLLENNQLKISSNHLSGAGGGIPSALQIFYKTSLLSSYEFIGNYLGIREYTADVDYLITGEGAFDSQSNSGKGARVMVDLFTEKIKKIFLLCGTISKEVMDLLPKNVYFIEMSKFFSNEEESIANYKEGIRIACRELVKQLKF